MQQLSFIAFVWLISAGWLSAGSPDAKPYQGSAEFERLKALVGTWQGKSDMGQGPTEFKVEYRLVAGGSALEERTFAGTPMEMVTLYHDRRGKLVLTHYCMLHNQPAMILKSADKQALHFDFDPACGIDEKSDSHMHALVVTFLDADTVTQEWTLFENGKAKEGHPFTLKRAKS